MIVQKYGGSSVASIDKIKDIAKGISQRRKTGSKIVVVVSAMGDTTDNLISMTREISTNPSLRELDMLLATGEQITSSLLSMALKEIGDDSLALTGFQAGIKTGNKHTKASILDIDIEKIKKHLDEDKIVIVAGFQGMDLKGDITTLGRGGSDTSAIALAAKLDCPCEIYTDVAGVYSMDPRMYSKAKKLNHISYEEMLEMASLGAKIIDPRAVEMASKYGVPIYIGLSGSKAIGTYIKEYDESMEKRVITGLTASDDDLMVTMNNVAYGPRNIYNIFSGLSQMDINVDMISQTAPIKDHVNISFTAPKSTRASIVELMEILKLELQDMSVNIKEDITKISVIGLGMKTQAGVATNIFKLFADLNIEFQQVTTSEIRISYTINTKDKERAIIAIAKEFNL